MMPAFSRAISAMRVAQEFLMIERNVGDHADPRFDHVGGIQPSAHADFEHGDIQLAGGEVLEGHGRQHLEEAGMPGQFAIFDQAFGGALDHIVHQRKSVIGDLLRR